MHIISIITSNYNSYSYLPLAKLSLYSIFRAIRFIKGEERYKIILVDSASTDGSFEELSKLGRELSDKTSIKFEAIRLSKDLGNSFAYAYGFLHSRKEGVNYIIYMDNDFIIINPCVLEEMENLANNLAKLNKKFYAIVPMFIHDDRYRGLKIARRYEFEDSLKIMYHDIKTNCQKILETNVEYLDLLGRVVHLFDSTICQIKDLLCLFEEGNISKKFLISPLAASTFSMHPSYVAPLFPYLYIWGDDHITAIQHTLRGLFSYVIPRIVGIHYGEFMSKYSSPKRSPKKAYYSRRNYVLSNFGYSSSKYLFYTTRLIYELFIWIPFTVFGIKKLIKSKYYVLGGYTPPNVAKYTVLGFMHGLLLNRRIAGMIEKWFSKYLNEKPKTILITYFKSRNPRINIIKLMLSMFLGDNEFLCEKDIEGLKKRILLDVRENSRHLDTESYLQSQKENSSL